MKTALLISGKIPTNFYKYYESIYKTTIGPFNSDVFISTWNCNNVDNIFALYKPVLYRVEDINCVSIKSRMNNFLYFLRNINYTGNKMLMLNSTYPMFYKIYDANNLKMEYENTKNIVYDLVIRCRFDLSFDKRHESMTKEPFLFNKISDTEINDIRDSIYLRIDINPVDSIPDSFAFCNSKNMNIYSSTFLHLEELIKSESIKNESILYKNLISNKSNLKHTMTIYDLKYYDR